MKTATETEETLNAHFGEFREAFQKLEALLQETGIHLHRISRNDMASREKTVQRANRMAQLVLALPTPREDPDPPSLALTIFDDGTGRDSFRIDVAYIPGGWIVDREGESEGYKVPYRDLMPGRSRIGSVTEDVALGVARRLIEFYRSLP